MRLAILCLTLILTLAIVAPAANLADCTGVIRVFGDVRSWMSTCFVVGDGSWAIAASDSLTEKVSKGLELPVKYPVFISTYTGQAWQCEVKAIDQKLGIALLKLPVTGLPSAPLAKFSEFTKCAYGTMGQVTSGEPVGNRWPTDIYGIVREMRDGSYRLGVSNWSAGKGIVTDADDYKWLFVSDVKPETAVPNGAMVTRQSNVVGMYLNRVVITYGRQNVCLGRCAMSSEIARWLATKGISTNQLYDPPAATIAREEGAGEAFQLRTSIYSQIGAGRAEAALSRAEALTKLRPKEADAHVLLGTALTAAGKFEDAIKSFDEAAKLDPNTPTLRTNRALALVGLKKRDEAEAELLKAAQESPNDPRPVTALTNFYMDDEKTLEKAVTYAQNVQSMSSSSPASQLLLARAQKRTKDYVGAIKSMQEALRAAPQWGDAWYALGTIYEDAGDNTNAERAYRRLIEIEPRSVRSLLTLASFLVDVKRKDEALELLAKIKELKPPQPVLDAVKALEEEEKRAGS